MLDKRCLALLKIINEQCADSGYKIFSIQELISLMPNHFGVDESVVYICIKTLTEREYISVKYQDEQEICLVPLVKGRLVFENAIDEKVERERAEKKYFIHSLLGGLIGAILGGSLGIFIALLFGGKC